MKSTEVYAIAREALAPWCKAQGFKRTKSGVLSWYKPAESGFVAFWFQCAQLGWEAYAGSSFTVEFQQADTARLYQFGVGCKRQRFSGLLDGAQLAEVRQLQNRIIAKLGPPPPGYYIYDMAPEIIASYLRRNFEPVTSDYTGQTDVWLRYHVADDVRLWAQFLVDAMPGMLTRFHPGIVT